MTIEIDKNIRLELTAMKHATALYEAVNKNRKHLSEFLPWVAKMESVTDFRRYIENCQLLYQQKKEVSFVILSDEVALGRIGLHHINFENKHAAIGYWLTKEAEGKGIMTKCCNELIRLGFEELALQRIEIKAAIENVRSQAIPEKLHFKKEGILREAEWVNNKFLDLVLYSLLKEEWLKEPQKIID